MHSKENNPDISIVVPLYNEYQSIDELFRKISDAFKGRSYETVFIDDGSTDGSYEKLMRLYAKARQPMTIVRLRKRCGKSAALAQGFRLSRGSIIVTLDADLQDDPKEALRLVDTMGSFDVIVGWRKSRRDSKGKSGVSYIFNRTVSAFTGLTLNDMNCGLKVMKSSVAKEIRLYGELHRFLPVLAHVRGFRVTEIAVAHHPRKYGTSKFGIERIFAAFDLLTTLFLSGFGSRPLIIFGPPGLILIALGLLALIYLTSLKFMGESIGTRPLLLLGVMFVLFGFQMLSTGLLGELITSLSGSEKKTPVADIQSTYEDNA